MAFRLLNTVLAEANKRNFPAYRIEAMKAHGSYLIALAYDLGDTKSLLLAATMKQVNTAKPRTVPEKITRLDATSLVTNLGNHGDLRRMSTEGLNELGLPVMMSLCGKRMTDCSRMSWNHMTRTADDYDFQIPNKTHPGAREHYHAHRAPRHPQIDPYLIIDELYRRAAESSTTGTPTGAVWRNAQGVPLDAKGVTKRIRIALTNAGYGDCNPNDIRAATITKLIELGVAPPDVARFVHHSLTSTAQFVSYQISDGSKKVVQTVLSGVPSSASDG
jgi:hypothetical protein